MKSLEVVSKR